MTASRYTRNSRRSLLPPSRSAILGSISSVVLVALLSAVMLPFRDHLSVATTALVLVVPVVAGVSIGGFGAGVVATATGFLVYDFLFIPPYYTLSIGAPQNWAALGVYVVVMIVVARVVSRLNVARSEAHVRTAEVRRLFDLSELLVRESPVADLENNIVKTVMDAFKLEGVALLLPKDGHVVLVASAGAEMSDAEIHQLSASTPVPVSLDTNSSRPDRLRTVALSTSGVAVGLLALRGDLGKANDHELLRAFANHLALALERARLREEAVRLQLLEEVDRLRRSLVGAVSHDLRSPLATIKVSVSALLDPDASLSDVDAKELLGLVDAQTDRLDRLVANLLDMTRIQSGTLEIRPTLTRVETLVDDALAVLGESRDYGRVRWCGSNDLPPVRVDQVLVGQVLVNLIDNAIRYSPEDAAVTIDARVRRRRLVEVAISDRGPGVGRDERASIFEMLNQREAGGRGGLGLAIARAFVEAHGERIWLEDAPGGGARFVFTLSAEEVPESETPAQLHAAQTPSPLV
ncbi:MAG: sensor histidine kinase [Acidimicrobiales bacterium]